MPANCIKDENGSTTKHLDGADRMGEVSRDIPVVDDDFHRKRAEEDVKSLTHSLAVIGAKLREVSLERDHARRGETLCWQENARLNKAWQEEQRQHEETRRLLNNMTDLGHA